MAKKKKLHVHKHTNYVFVEPRGRVKRPKRVKPRQSMNLDEIMKKYVRGLPLDAALRDDVYLKNSEGVDYEKMSKLDFDDKAAIAAQNKAFAKQYVDDTNEATRQVIEEAEEIRRQNNEQKRREQSEPASDTLDNTLADDTRASDRGGLSKSNRQQSKPK